MIRITGIVSAALVGFVGSTSAHASVIVWTETSGGNGHAYEFVEVGLMPWGEASAVAQEMTFQGVSGHLATITDADEQFFINSIPGLDPGFFPALPIGMWLGGFQADPSDPPNEGWAWVTGEAWSFTDWAKSQPDDAFGPESFVAMVVPSPRPGETFSGWSDDSGDSFLSFVNGLLVEYDLPAPPSPFDLNGDGDVNGLDLTQLLAAWTGGATYRPCPPVAAADFNGDCRVNGFDLAQLLAAWAP